MFRLKRILLIAPAEMTRTPAFDRAQALARASGALLHIVAFDHVQSLALAGLIDHDAMAQAREGYLQMHRQWLEQQARFQRGAGVQVSTEVVWARATPAHVLEYINDFHVDLVIKDAHHVSALNQTFHQPLDWLLVRDCSACVHLVTEAAHPKPLKMLAAIDLSHLEDLTQVLNDRILGVASTLASKCDASLHLLNVANWSVVGDAAMSVPNLSLDHSLCDAINDTQQEAFDTLAERYGLDEQHSHLLSGVPYRVIEDFARQNAFDLLVLGICHHQALDGFIGGTAECLMNRAPCSLMMVKAMPATA